MGKLVRAMIMIILFVGIFSGCGTDVLEENVKESDIRIGYLNGSFSVGECISPSSNPSYSAYYCGSIVSMYVESFNEVSGNITGWRFQIKNNDRVLISISNGDYNPYSIISSTLRVNAYKSASVGLKLDSQEIGFHSRLLAGNIPNIITLEVDIKDDNGYSYTLNRTASFNYDYQKCDG